MTNTDDTRVRCGWVTANPLYIAYHDREWGVPLHDDRLLFEYLTLEGAQAGLSWLTVLHKRQNYRAAFANFDPATVARFDEADVARLLADPGIIRNRLKINAAIANARVFLSIQREYGSFDSYIWAFVANTPIINDFASLADLPAKTALSDAISKDLRARGMGFVGSTICYAFMQAVGMVNDHTRDCWRRTF